jgi:urease alpha subunit
MNAINRGLVSPSVMRAAVSGGVTTAVAGGKSGSPTIHITNLNDPRMIDRHLATAEGRASLVNHMGQNKMAIRKALGV